MSRTRALTDRLTTVRGDADLRRLVVAVGGLLGLILATVHWLGFVVGGAIVALAQPTLRRGLLAGVAFGAVAWLGFLAWLALEGALGTYAGMGELLALSTAIPLACGFLGGLLRGVF